MAKKLTEAEKLHLLLTSSFSDTELDDPRVDAIIERNRQQEEAAKQEQLKHRWDNVDGGTQSTESAPAPVQPTEPASQGLWGGAPDPVSKLLSGPVAQSVGDNWNSSMHALNAGNSIGLSDIAAQLTQSLLPQGNMGAGGAAFNASPIGQLAAASMGGRNTAVDEYAKKLQSDQDAAKRLKDIDWMGGQTVAQALGGVANPQSLSSLVPGVGPGLAAALSYPASYGELRFAGAKPGEAALGAAPSAIAEYAGAKLGNSLHADLSPLSSTAGRAAAKWVGEAGQEGLGELATSLMQSANYKAVASTSDNTKLTTYANQRAAQWATDGWQSLVGGLLVGGAAHTPAAINQYAAEQGAYAQENLELLAKAQRTTEEFNKKPKLGAVEVGPRGTDINVPNTTELAYIQKEIQDIKAKSTPYTMAGDVSRINELVGKANELQGLPARPGMAQQATAPDSVDDSDEGALIPVSELQKLRDSVAATEAAFPEAIAEPEAHTNNDVTPVQVVQSLSAQLGSRDSNIATRLLSKGHTQLVADASQIPDNAQQQSAVGWYDGKTTYVVANQLDPNAPLLPQLLSVMGHEVKHGVDASGYEHTLGKQANDAIINQATALAKGGDARALSAFEKATGTTDITKPLSEREKMELVSYSINNAMDDSSKGWAAIKRTAGAAWREKGRQLGLNKGEVKIDDLRYLTKSMLESVATSDKSLAGALPDNNGGQGMLLPAKYMEKTDRSYVDAFGKKKFILSDKDATVDEGVLKAMAEGRNSSDPDIRAASEQGIPLSQVLTHGKLFDKMKFLGNDVTVKVAPLGEGIGGNYDPETKTITLAPDTVTKPILTDEGPAPTVKGILLHELQHAIQGETGYADQYYRKSDGVRKAEAAINTHERDYVDASEQLTGTIDILKEQLPAAEREAVSSIMASDKMSKVDKAEAISEALSPLLSGDGKKLGPMVQVGLEEFQKAQDAYDLNSNPDYQQAVFTGQHEEYMKNMMELEGHYTQDNANTDSTGDVNPEPKFRRAQLTDGDNNVIKDYTGDARRPAGMAQTSNKTPRATRDNATHEIVDRQTGKVVDWAIGTSSALRKVDNRDNAYGGYRYQANRIRENTDSAVPQKAAPTGMAQTASTSKQRAKDAAPADKLTNREGKMYDAYRLIARTLMGDEGVGKTLNELKLSVGNQAAALGAKGAQLDAHLEGAIAAASKLKGNTMESVKEQIDTTIAGADKNGTMEARKSAIAKLDRMYPDSKLGTMLNRVRENNWEMTQLLIDARLKDTARPLTKKEFATYEKMIKQEERWTTRAYESQMGHADLYAKTFMERAKDINSKQAKMLGEALDTIKGSYLLVDPKKTLETSTVDELTKLYKTWNLGGMRELGEGKDLHANLVKRLDFLKSVDQKTLDAKAMEIAKDLIGVTKNENPGAIMIRGMRQNRTIIEARTQLAKSIRAIMGEVTDPRLRLSVSTARLTQLVASTRALSELHQTGEGKFWSSKKEGPFTEQLNSKTYGPLDGKYVTKDLNYMLGTYTNYNETLDATLKGMLTKSGEPVGKAAATAVNTLHQVSQWAKFAMIPSNPATALINLAGSPLTLVKNGVMNPVHTARAFYDTAALLTTKGLRNASPERMKLNQELLAAGTTDSAIATGFKADEWKRLNADLKNDNTDSISARAANLIGRRLSVGKNVIGTTYAFMDMWTKTATYYANKAADEAYNKAEGITKTDEEVIRNAGYNTTLSTISYGRASPLVKAIEKNIPVGGAFATYTAESIRSVFGGLSVANHYFQLGMDAKTTKGKAIAFTRGAQQLGGTLAATAGIMAATTAWLNSRDDEDKLKRKLYPDFERDKVHVLIGKDDKGREHYAAINRLDPIGPFNEPAVSFAQAMQNDKGIGKATMSALNNFGATLSAQKQILKLVTDLGTAIIGGTPSKYTRETAIERAYPEQVAALKESASFGNIGANALSVAETVIPSWFVVAGDSDRLNIKGEGAEVAGWLKSFGYKDVVVDPDKSLGFRAGDYIAAMKKLGAKRDAILRSGTNPDAMMDKLVALRQDEQEAFSTLADATLAYRQFNKQPFIEGIAQNTKEHLDEDNAYAVLKERKVPSGQLGNVIQGTFKSSLIDTGIVKKWEKLQKDKLEKTDPDYESKLEDIGNRAALLEQSLGSDRRMN